MNWSIPTPEDVAEALSVHRVSDQPSLPGRTNHLPAGVLVPLVWDPDPICLLTLRPRSLRQHGGEICFPGGRPEESDLDLEATALRETAEELGIFDVRVLGRLCTQPLYTSDYRLVPYVGEVTQKTLSPAPGEVARVLPQNLLGWLRRDQLDGLPYVWKGESFLSPVFTLQDGLWMYGATAHTFLELLEVVAPCYGCEVPPMRPGTVRWEDIQRVMDGTSG